MLGIFNRDCMTTLHNLIMCISRIMVLDSENLLDSELVYGHDLRFPSQVKLDIYLFFFKFTYIHLTNLSFIVRVKTQCFR